MSQLFGGSLAGFVATPPGSDDTPIPVVQPPYTIEPGNEKLQPPYQFGIKDGVAPDQTLPFLSPGSKTRPQESEQESLPADGFVKPIKGPVVN